MNTADFKLRGFKALTFDCYGTLIDWERGILDALGPWLRRCGLNVESEQLLSLYSESEPKQEAATPGKPYPDILRAVLSDIATKLGADVSPAELDAFSRSVADWPAFPDSPEALLYLKQHYKLIIISNIDRASFTHSNAKLGVAFDAIITAEEVGSYKPDLRNFEYALRRLREMGVEPTQVLHVAQSLYHDHVPAQSLRLRTVWVNRRSGRAGTGATPVPNTNVQPDLVVNDLANLADLHRAEGHCEEP